MCGITGLLTSGRVDPELLQRMAGAIAHRGPDDHGVWTDQDAGVGFGHRRLSIVDLSPLGHQPMLSASGRFVLCYNGEIYNHGELRRELELRGEGPPGGWRGYSDTETLIECISAWGLEQALTRCVGMFAFGLWDRKQRSLSLVRDRFGEKPLYFGWVGGDFVFASELKALRVHPDFDNAIDREALKAFAARAYVPAPLTIYQRLFKLEPGCILTISPAAATTALTRAPRVGTSAGGLSLQRYWSYREVAQAGLADPIADEGDALDELEAALCAAIEGQSIADVPTGAFLSGGIDSSTVVAFYQKLSSSPVRTFTIGFEQDGFDEAGHARAVARHLGTIHEEHYVSVAEARDVIPSLPAMYDEPFADSSQIPTHLVSRFARAQVTVALSGDGGDELFGGYNRHLLAPAMWRRMRKVPRPLRAIALGGAGRLPAKLWTGAAKLLPGHHSALSGGKLRKGAQVAGAARSYGDVHADLTDEWANEASPVLGAEAWDDRTGVDTDVGSDAPDTVRSMYADAVGYLPDDILCKVDRAAMAVSLETRVPFLDHRLAAVAARIPVKFKVHGGAGKQVLRKLLFRQAPPALFDRPKAGFAVPVGEWLKGPLRSWAEDLLNPAALTREGWFDPKLVRRRWADHLSGRRDSTQAIWAILMFEAWRREQASSD